MKRRVPLPAGTLLNGCYSVKHLMAEGGFSLVYAAESQGRQWVIKELFDQDRCSRNAETGSLEPLDGQAGLHERQLQRARGEWTEFRSVKHRHIVELADFFETNGTGYFVMPFTPGESLMERVDRAPLQIGELLALLTPIAEALEFLHSRRMMHRDVKPDNIWIRKSDGQPMLLDMGAARSLEVSKKKHATSIFTMLGAPELRGPNERSIYGEVGPATDVFAMAGISAYALTGREPPDPAIRVIEGDAKSLHVWPMPVSEPLRESILWGLKLNVRDRPQTAKQFLTTLNNAHIRNQFPPVRSVNGDVRNTTNPIASVAGPQIDGKVPAPLYGKRLLTKGSKKVQQVNSQESRTAIDWVVAGMACVFLAALLEVASPLPRFIGLMIFLIAHAATVIVCSVRRRAIGQRLLPVDITPVLNLVTTFTGGA
jgi:serine/threonine protein kinase